MKTFVKGAMLSFFMFSLVLYLFSLSATVYFEFLFFALPLAFPIIYAVCFATESFIILAEWKWYGRKFDWFIVPAALTISLPFWQDSLFSLPIFVGALGYYIGRKLPDHPLVFGLAAVPPIFSTILLAVTP
jgi:hypothetical protein